MAVADAADEVRAGAGVNVVAGEQPAMVTAITSSNASGVLRNMDVPQI